MRRRPILLAIATGTTALAGCLGDQSTDDGTGGGSDDDGRSNGSGSDETVLDHFDSKPDRPECEVDSETIEIESDDGYTEYETAATVPYPDPPASVSDEDAVVEYVEDFEHAYVTQNTLCERNGSDHILNIGFHVQKRETLDRHDDITTVFLYRAGGATWGVEDDGPEWATELAYDGVVYAVDETGVARVDFPEADPWMEEDVVTDAPDPLETGELVSLFD